MKPLSSPVYRRAASPGADSDEDLDDTVSFSGSDDDLPDPPALQALAQALLTWEPSLVATYARLDHVAGELAPFADFLVRLKQETQGQAALRGEITGWLQGLATDQAARSRAFRMACGVHGAGTALETYRAIRTATQQRGSQALRKTGGDSNLRVARRHHPL